MAPMLQLGLRDLAAYRIVIHHQDLQWLPIGWQSPQAARAPARLIGFDGNAKITEFGSLRTRNSTVTNVSVPTRLQPRTPFMAPELRAQVQANAIPVIERRADVYSIGALLWEMLTGESLNVGDDVEPPPPPGVCWH